MAVVDIDRHILLEIAGFQNKTKQGMKDFFVEWRKITEARDKMDALLFSSPDSPERSKALGRLKKSLFKSTDKASKLLQSIVGNLSKQEALLSHLVSLVVSVETGKGLERVSPDINGIPLEEDGDEKSKE